MAGGCVTTYLGEESQEAVANLDYGEGTREERVGSEGGDNGRCISVGVRENQYGYLLNQKGNNGVFMSDNSTIRFLEPGEVQAILEAPSLGSLAGLRNKCIP